MPEELNSTDDKADARPGLLVPPSLAERIRAELIANGDVLPRRFEDLGELRPAAATQDEPTLSEILGMMRDQERT
ncbi:hypothetical protein ACFXJ8_41685 [Nonomuraea sp. NPDC059194]|uniref:hypothetical protein n=1 Tax=Nonomuraea sp. NPDC059194 TaxID=3346764 RepID=UPI0036AEF4D4